MLRARVITALCLIAGFLAVLFLLPTHWAALVFAIVAVLAAGEWAGLVKASRIERGFLVGLVLGGCGSLWISPNPFTTILWMLVSLFWVVGAPLWLWRMWRLADRRGLGIVGGGLLIVAAWAALVDLHARSPALLLAAMGLVWIADSAAYFSGRAFGRHKLAPNISPGKTWEGVAGGLLGILAYGGLLAVFLDGFRNVSPAYLVGALLLLGFISVIGDLFESLAKRQAGIKDSGTLLPGHGGVLDRIDSLLPTLPLAALLVGRTAG